MKVEGISLAEEVQHDPRRMCHARSGERIGLDDGTDAQVGPVFPFVRWRVAANAATPARQRGPQQARGSSPRESRVSTTAARVL
jgi:hypothetical protein